MSRQSPARTKPHLNIGTIGHLGHGKTTLTAAITAVLGRPGVGGAGVPPYGPAGGAVPAAGGVVPDAGRDTPGRPVEYETGTRHYAHTDLPGHPDLVPAVIAGASQLDGVILVVSATDGVKPQTAEHLLLARQAGVDHVVVALTKTETLAPDSTGRAEPAVRALLSAHGYPGRSAPVVRVSAAGALAGDPRWTGTVEALLDAVDTYLPTPLRYGQAPFLLPVQTAATVPGRGTVVTGTVERGTVRAGDRVAPLGLGDAGAGPAPVAVVETVRAFGGAVEYAEAGDAVAVLLRGAGPGAVRPGQVLAAPGSLVPCRRFTARVQTPPGADDGAGPVRLAAARAPFTTRARPRFHLRTADVPGVVDLAAAGPGLPDRALTMTVELGSAVPLEPGLGFAVRAGGRTVGAGTVITVLD
ncbi:GTP-binding protein [Streptomyces pactum]|uniref:GTP-binding protein n=1 Tax=Streptomyces pactum TaxID=68249 RepID=UPI0036FE26DE